MHGKRLPAAVQGDRASTPTWILGDGEWQSHQHKTSNQRRSWRQLHLGIDGDGYLIASALTDRTVDDACVAISMLEQIEGSIARFTADGAYDSRPMMYEALAAAGATDIRIVIPPKKSADANGERSRAPTSRLGPRTGCTDVTRSRQLKSGRDNGYDTTGETTPGSEHDDEGNRNWSWRGR